MHETEKLNLLHDLINGYAFCLWITCNGNNPSVLIVNIIKHLLKFCIGLEKQEKERTHELIFAMQKTLTYWISKALLRDDSNIKRLFFFFFYLYYIFEGKFWREGGSSKVVVTNIFIFIKSFFKKKRLSSALIFFNGWRFRVYVLYRLIPYSWFARVNLLLLITGL